VLNVIATYRRPDARNAVINLAASGGLYAVSIAMLGVLITAELPLAFRLVGLLAAYLFSGLVIVKIFTIQHDCGHESYIGDARLNRALGRFCAILTFIPFTAWKEEHAEHHACFAKLDEQTFGDVLLLTVEQFKAASFWQRVAYRAFRHPGFLLCLAPLAYVLIRQRFPSRPRKSRVISCAAHTTCLFLIYGAVLHIYGFIVLAIIVPPLYVATAIGVIIFVIEHQFEAAEWTSGSEWRLRQAAIDASSYVPMPRVLAWLTGYVGYHHLHHFNPRIPSYRLKPCFSALGERFPCKAVLMSDVPRNIRLSLWSHELNRLVTFNEAKWVAR
jgi:omega-6 fatty acid desaturase (delta-12 desaturase)